MSDLPDPAIDARIAALPEWRVVYHRIDAHYRAGSFEAATALAGRIAAAAEAAQHHPDINIRYPDRIHVVLTTHATGGLTDLDADLAVEVSRYAVEAGATPEPERAQVVEVAIDALDIAAVVPFWRAVLGYIDDGDAALRDPLRIGPRVWFQQMDAARPQRNRIHLDVNVAPDAADARVAAALAAGGRLVSDAHTPAWRVLADAEGNEVCVCTWQAPEA
jgi:4a-hydroxytetrahydrobiopterin dehydratase